MQAFENAGWSVSVVSVPDPDICSCQVASTPACDPETKDDVKKLIQPNSLPVAVGSGVVSDLTKWAAFELGLPYLCFATAASMNGYASANVAPTIGGVKSLIHARPPVGVFTRPDVLCEAPHVLTASGLGDILAKSVSSADWMLNHILFNDYYCQRSVDLIAEIEPLYMDTPEKILYHEPEAMSALFEGLLLTGAAMTMAGSSAPASGGEHLISHTLDMRSSITNTRHDLHGRQVGIGTVLCAEIYRRVLAVVTHHNIALRQYSDQVDADYWCGLSANVREHFQKKLERIPSALMKIESETVCKNIVSECSPLLRTPQTIRTCLKNAGAAYLPEHIGQTLDSLRQALLHAHQMRSRFTVLDMAWLLGILPDQVDAVLDVLAD